MGVLILETTSDAENALADLNKYVMADAFPGAS